MGRYAIVPDRSRVVINARSSVHPIHSETEGLEGFVSVELADDGSVDVTRPASGRLSFPVAKLRSGNPLEDRELRRRILADRHPTIEGELSGLEAGSGPDQYLVTGTIRFRGVEQAYVHEMHITKLDDGSLELKGEAVFDVRDFGMQPPRILMLRVEPDVTVAVDIVATPDA